MYLETFVYEDNSETVEREYIYYHPESAPSNCPLVFVFHGYTGSAVDIMQYSEFNAIADNFGFAVCYPQAGFQRAVDGTTAPSLPGMRCLGGPHRRLWAAMPASLAHMADSCFSPPRIF